MDFQGIKDAASGRCGEIITALTVLPAEVMAKRGKDHPCPLCGGKSVLYPDDRDGGARQHGRIVCRKCTDGSPTGDVIDTVRVFGGLASQGEAAAAVRDYLGLSAHRTANPSTPPSIIDAVAKAKRMPIEAFRVFGPTEERRGRDRRPVARVPVYNEKGEIHSHFDMTPNDKGFFRRGAGSSGLFLPDRLPAGGETWAMVEGVKDAAALIGLGYLACGLPSSFMAAKYAGLFRDVHVVVVPDLDNAGQRGARRSGGNLAGIAASVRIARLPGELLGTKGADVRDVIRQSGADAVRNAIEQSTPWTPDESSVTGGDDRPEEVLTLRYQWHVDRVIAYLGRVGWDTPWIPDHKCEARKLYQRGGQLVEVVTETRADATAKGGRVKIASGTPRIRPLPIQQLPLRIADACQLVSEKETGGDLEVAAVPPPRWLVDGIHTAGDYGNAIRHLDAIVTAPTIRSDGSVLQKPGWDASGLLYQPSMRFDPVPNNPTRSDAWEAAEALFDVVTDFPFTDEADRSAWLSMVLTMIGRPCVTGQSPMFAVSANIRGAGKSMLVDAASIIAYGHAAARMNYVSSDDEMRKQITSIVLEGSPAVLLDNIDRPIGGASLDAVLTAEHWRDRELGSSRTIELPARTVWTATGNNLRFRSDIARRVVPIRLESPLERPEKRTDFRHDDLIGHVFDKRGPLVRAALIMLRAYFSAGLPAQNGGIFGSFESWARIIRGAVVWAGCADPMETIEAAEADDDTAAVVAGLIGGLLEIDETGDGLTCRQIIEALNTPENTGRFGTMREVVSEIGANKSGKPDPRVLGYQLRKYRGRVANGFKIIGETSRTKTVTWKVKSAGDAGDAKTDHLHPSPAGLMRGKTGSNQFAGDAGDNSSPRTGETVCVAHMKGTNGETHTSSIERSAKPSPASPASPAEHPGGRVEV